MFHKLLVILTGMIFLQPGSCLGAGSTGKWDHEELNTAANATYLNDFEKQVVLELNKARSNPTKYAEDYLENLIDAYDGKVLKIPGGILLKTNEGKKALLECIREMKKTEPLPLLYPSEGLSQAAGVLVSDQQKSGQVGHIGKNGSNPQNRIEQFGNWSERIAENITYGNNSPQRVVVSLLVDDGVPERGHRKNLLTGTFKMVGIATGSHPGYQQMCVIEMAGGFENK